MIECLYDDQNMTSGVDVKQLKRTMTLDFNNGNKRNKNIVLESPDLKMLKLASPDLERMIIANGCVTTTPTPGLSHYFKDDATAEQMGFAQGFVDALQQLHETNGHNNTTSSESSADLTIADQSRDHSSVIHPFDPPSYSSAVDNNASMYPMTIKIESEDASTRVAPIDMADQERIKLERKRLRNRIAASKCRRRKLERISRLEDKVRNLKGENSELSIVVNKLRDQICGLKQQVMTHVKHGCHLMVPQQ